MWTVNIQMFKLGLEKAEEPDIKLPGYIVSSKKQESSEKHLLLLYWLCQTFDCVDHNKLENFESNGNTRPPNIPPEKS